MKGIFETRKLNSIILTILLLLSSVPVAFSEEGSSDDNRLEIKERYEQDGTEFRYEEKDDEIRTELKERVRDKAIDSAKTEIKQRIRLRKDEARERFELAKERYEERRELHKKRKDELNSIRERYKACQESDTEECIEIRGRALETGEAFLLNAADVFIEHMEKLIARVEESDLADERKEIIVNDLNSCIEGVQDAKAKVEASSTIEELRESSRALHAAMKECRSSFLSHKKAIKHREVGRIISAIKNYMKKLERIMNYVEEKDVDVDISSDVESFRAKINDAETAYQQGDYKEAASLLKEAHKMLKDILRKVKAADVPLDEASGGDEPEEEDETEEEDEEEEGADENELEDDEVEVE